MKFFFFQCAKQSSRFLAQILIIMESLMLDKYKRLIEESIAYKAVLPSSAWLAHTFDSFVAAFYEKPQKDDLAYFKKWEREKILSLGLASAPDPLKRSRAKNIRFRSWHQEKAQSLGLSTPSAPKSPPQPVQFSLHKPALPTFKPSFSLNIAKIRQLNLRLQTLMEGKIEPHQVIDKMVPEKAGEDFFKTLGYE
jgi:hypothetical protein